MKYVFAEKIHRLISFTDYIKRSNNQRSDNTRLAKNSSAFGPKVSTELNDINSLKCRSAEI